MLCMSGKPKTIWRRVPADLRRSGADTQMIFWDNMSSYLREPTTHDPNSLRLYAAAHPANFRIAYAAVQSVLLQNDK